MAAKPFLLARWLLLLLAGAGAATAQAPGERIAFEDVFYLKKGGTLQAERIGEDDEAFVLRDRTGSRFRLEKDRVARHKTKEEVYLDEGRAALAKGDLDGALDHLRFLVDQVPEDSPWRSAAEREVENVYYEFTSQGMAIVVLHDGRTHIGRVHEKGDAIVVVRGQGGPYIARRSIDRILRLDDLLLARGDRYAREGKREQAAVEYRRLLERHVATRSRFHELAVGRLGRTYGTLGEEATAAGRVEEGYELLARASRLLPLDADIRTALEAAEAARREVRQGLKAEALALIEQARGFYETERYPEALTLAEKATAVAPWLDEARDFRRRCQDQLLLLVCAETDLPRDFRPGIGSSAAEARGARLLFGSLIDLDEDGRPVLDLARSLEIGPDDLEFRFVLRPGLTWSDGRPLTARDVQFSAGAWTHPDTTGRRTALARHLVGLEVPDLSTIVFRFGRRHRDPLRLFRFPVLPAHRVGSGRLTRLHPFFESPIGSGPYVLGEVREDEVVFYKNLRYHRPDRPRIYGVVFRRFDHPEAALAAFAAGEVDAWPDVDPGAIARLAADPENVRLYPTGPALEALLFNHRHPLLASRKVRRAIGRALPREEALTARTGGRRPGPTPAALATGPFVAGDWRTNPAVSAFSYEPAYGRELLREVLGSMGYELRPGTPLAWVRGEETLTLRLVHPAGDPAVLAACRRLEAGIEELGFAVDLVALDPDRIATEIVGGHDFDLLYARFRFDASDEPLWPLVDPAARQAGGSNVSGYLNPSLAEEFMALAAALDPAERARRHQRIHEILVEDAFALFLWHLDRRAATSIRVLPAARHPELFFRRVEDWRLVTFE